MADNKPKMLFVDDSTKRIHAALEVYGEKYDLTICANVPEALRQLSRGNWDVLSFDFDLNGYDFQDPHEKTSGMEIVRYIATCGWPEGLEKPVIIIHSSNAFGANLMYTAFMRLDFKVHCEPFQYPENGR